MGLTGGAEGPAYSKREIIRVSGAPIPACRAHQVRVEAVRQDSRAVHSTYRGGASIQHRWNGPIGMSSRARCRSWASAVILRRSTVRNGRQGEDLAMRRVTAFLVGLLVCGLGVRAEDGPTVPVGVAQIDITPRTPIRL